MGKGSAISGLMFVTPGIVAVLGLGLLIWHMRKSSNRKPMDGVRERNYDEMKKGKPPESE